MLSGRSLNDDPGEDDTSKDGAHRDLAEAHLAAPPMDTAADAAAEARAFVQALQDGNLDSEMVMHLINTPLQTLCKELSKEKLATAVRFKKIFAKLSPDFAADGILSEAELLEIKTRSWAFYESSSVIGTLDVTSKRSADIIDTVVAATYRFLRRRTQYLQCMYFVCLIGVMLAVLSFQQDVTESCVRPHRTLVVESNF